jgi:geranylgeranyl diphosphate synthase type II
MKNNKIIFAIFAIILVCIVLIILEFGRKLPAKTYIEYKDEIDKYLFDNRGEFAQLEDSCYYSIKNGKRIRSVIILEITRLMGSNKNFLPLASAIEYIHNSSLIIDDMEYFDNDDYRRGEMSVHFKYGSAVAHMTALTLMVCAFKNVSTQVEITNQHHLSAYLNYFINDQLQSTAIGQIQDMYEKDIDNIIKNKTSTLFEISTVSAWLLAGGKKETVEDVREFGRNFAFILQLCDDIDDSEKDASIDHANYLNINGIDKTFDKIQLCISEIGRLSKKLGLKSPLWDEIIEILTSKL